MQKLAVLVALFLLTSCKDTLDKITVAAADLKRCKIDQKYPEDCSKDEKDLEILITTANKEGIKSERIYASKHLGELKVEGEVDKNSYSILTENLNKELASYPLRIPLEKTNYDGYWKYCYKNKLENVKDDDGDQEKLRKLALIINEASVIDKYVVKIGHIVKNNHLDVIVTSYSGCIPDLKEEQKLQAIKYISLISKEQLINLSKGMYISSNAADIENGWQKDYKFNDVTIYLALDFDDGNEIYKVLSSEITNPNLRTEHQNLILKLAQDNFLKNIDTNSLEQ